MKFFPGSIVETLLAKVEIPSSSAQDFGSIPSVGKIINFPFFADLGVALLIFGCILFVISFCACCGACGKWRPLLLVFIIAMIVLILGQAVVGGLFLAKDSILHEKIKETFGDEVTKNYKDGNSNAISIAMDILNLQGCYDKIQEKIQDKIVMAAVILILQEESTVISSQRLRGDRHILFILKTRPRDLSCLSLHAAADEDILPLEKQELSATLDSLKCRCDTRRGVTAAAVVKPQEGVISRSRRAVRGGDQDDFHPMRRGDAKSFVDDLVLGRGVVLSRAATSLRSIETEPWTRRFVRIRRRTHLRRWARVPLLSTKGERW
ncbi:hypothetical protein C0Q70_12178 [Pomacea canaliculata]|uniref:Tetraspanin n=1 Tax=Pomacea canaliculata TaxID=400727 RepID=A0A2T7P0S6_POMCA|nr:hypothetical protein C0Q70_12178 [Pomacea canaliculata]